MPTICSGGRLVFLLTAFVLAVAPLQGGATAVDFKAIPKLQEMKERMDAPDSTRAARRFRSRTSAARWYS